MVKEATFADACGSCDGVEGQAGDATENDDPFGGIEERLLEFGGMFRYHTDSIPSSRLVANGSRHPPKPRAIY